MKRLAVVLASVTLLAGCGGGDEGSAGNATDRGFIDTMIPHHQSAIDMANVALKNTNNPRIRELATNIVDAQKREIEQMKQWRQQWYPEG